MNSLEAYRVMQVLDEAQEGLRCEDMSFKAALPFTLQVCALAKLDSIQY